MQYIFLETEVASSESEAWIYRGRLKRVLQRKTLATRKTMAFEHKGAHALLWSLCFLEMRGQEIANVLTTWLLFRIRLTELELDVADVDAEDVGEQESDVVGGKRYGC